MTMAISKSNTTHRNLQAHTTNCNRLYNTQANDVILTNNCDTAGGKSEYFHREICSGNTNAPLGRDLTATCAGATKKGDCVFPANNRRLTSDADGNLSFVDNNLNRGLRGSR
jgi:hypothetical protein